MQELLKEIDPDGSRLRKAHQLKRRAYHSILKGQIMPGIVVVTISYNHLVFLYTDV